MSNQLTKSVAPVDDTVALSRLSASDCPDSAFVTNRPEIGRELLAHMSRYESPATKRLVDCEAEEFEVLFFYAHLVPVESKIEGDEARAVRLVMETPEGETYETTSDGVRKKLEQAIRVLGPGPWNPPLKCKVRKDTSKNRRAFYGLEIS